MESTTVQAVNLFEGEIPPLQQLLKLAQTVHSSELSRLDFTEKVQSFLSKTGQDAVLACGIGLVIIGRYKEAVEKLNNAKDCAQKFAFLAIALKNRGKFKEAVEAAEKAAGLNDCEKWAMLFIATTYSEQKRHDEADKIIKKLEEKFQNDDQVQCSKAWANETRGLYSRACECYQDALQRNQNNQLAMFRLAYLADILGDDEAAIDYYKKLLELKPNYINALINLAVIYEDNLQFKKAENCINKVLQYFPNHQKARMLKKDIEAAITMCYDEESEKKRSRRNQLLDTPISDFELSVRSRNCLKKMNIHTIGDLMKITEAELLSYKNFGETSLREIKTILDSKNLRLGMALEEGQIFEQPEQPVEQEDAMQKRPIEDLQLSVRARKCLIKLNIRTFGDLTKKTEAELLGCKNFGVTSLNEIKKAIEAFGLSLRSLE